MSSQKRKKPKKEKEKENKGGKIGFKPREEIV